MKKKSKLDEALEKRGLKMPPGIMGSRRRGTTGTHDRRTINRRIGTPLDINKLGLTEWTNE